MKEKLIALPVLMALMGGQAYASPSVFSQVDGIIGIGSPDPSDVKFSNNSLSATLAHSGTGYVLEVFSGAKPGDKTSLLLGDGQSTYIPITGSYDLRAYFDNQGHFAQTYGGATSLLTISGTVNPGSILPAGASAPAPDSLLYSANLTNFGFNDGSTHGQYSLGFQTAFNSSWTFPAFTGPSIGEQVYLLGIGFSGENQLTTKALVDAFGLSTAGLDNLLAASGGTYTLTQGINSIATVPLPMPTLLFGTGVTALMGFARNRRKSSSRI